MTAAAPSVPLWEPDSGRVAAAAVTRFQAWAAERYGAPVPEVDNTPGDRAV